MIGLGRVWKAVKGGTESGGPAVPSTIPRDIAVLRPTAVEPAGTPSKVSWARSRNLAQSHEEAKPDCVGFPTQSGLADAAPSETRSAERFVPNKTATVLTTTGGKRLAARIINISRTGVAVEPESAGVTADEIVMVGTRPVTPGRRIALGMVFLFNKPLDPKLCGRDIIL